MPENTRDLQLMELKDTIKQLNKLIQTLQQTIEAANAREAQLCQERDNLKEQIDFLNKRIFASSSEKRREEIPGQLSLFNEAEAEASDDIPAELLKEKELMLEESEKGSRKKRSTNKERFKGLPVEQILLDIPKEARICPECGTAMEKIGTEFVRRELKYVPAKLTVLEYYSVNYGCPVCHDEADVPVIQKGKDGKPHALHGMADVSTVAWIMYQKYFNGMPLYRMEQDWKQFGLRTSRATFANWVIANALDYFRPMADHFRKKLLERSVLMADETTTQVLDEPGRRARSQSYMWLFRTGEDGEHPIIIYKYSPTRAGETAEEFLEGYDGYLMCDGYSGYNKVTSARRTVCWAHIRRYLIDAIPKGKQFDYSQPAVQGLMYVNKLFELEDKIRKKSAGDHETIRKLRLEFEKPVVDGLLSWLKNQKPVRGSRMDKAVNYIRNREPYLSTYLEDGRCSFHNNLSENSIRPFVVGRKGWMFSATQKGAEASALIYTMVENAKANGVNVYQYLAFLLEKQPNKNMDGATLEKLAPWNPAVKELLETKASIGLNGNN